MRQYIKMSKKDSFPIIWLWATSAGITITYEATVKIAYSIINVINC